MAMTLYAHPLSSYSQKALVALYEKDATFTYRRIDEPGGMEELARLWPLKKFPVLVDGDAVFIEASIIVEHVDLTVPGSAPLLPRDAVPALPVRFLDRFFDNHIHGPMQSLVADALRPADARDPYGVARGRERLEASYDWLDAHMAGLTWANGDAFCLADCAAAPALFYADWVHRITDRWPNVQAYRGRLNARPSFARCIAEARPFRRFFPLGAPDRD